MHQFRIDYYRHKCTAYLLGLLNWDHRVQVDTRRLASKRRQLEARHRREQLAAGNSRTTSNSSTLSSFGSVNGSIRRIHGHTQKVPVTMTSAVEDDLDELSRPLATRDFTLTPTDYVASEERAGEESGFDGSSEAGSEREFSEMTFKIEDYIWESSCLREEYDEFGMDYMKTTYFIEGEVENTLTKLFGPRRKKLATPRNSARSERLGSASSSK